MAEAHRMLADGRTQHRATIPLGPALGQCCGGSVTLLWDVAEALNEQPRRPLWIYGAGHVGRAIVHVMQPLPDFAITWVDVAADRFPQTDVTTLVAVDPAQVVRHAPDDAAHLILTYSHALDLALCHAILSRPFANAGLIGSATKWARFRRRLADLGHNAAQIDRIACPIGDPALGKHQAALALGVATAMIGAETRHCKERRA
jgi:xanthine dehydrogenase accessory factor